MSTLRGIALAALTLLTLSTAACAAADPLSVYAHPQQLVRLPDGRAMNLYCLGKRGPVVLFDAGLGGTTMAWGKVQRGLAGKFRACAYDRAGVGFSDPGPMPRDTAHMADDLRAMAKAARLPGPYILVGHSLGGLTTRLYASRHPEEVAGLVLVDPSGEHQQARLNAAVGVTGAPRSDPNAGRRACLVAAETGLKPGTPQYDRCVGKPPERWPKALGDAVTALKLRPSYHQAQVSEFDSLATADSDQIIAGRRSLGAMPLIVLTAENTYRTDGIPLFYADALSAEWMRMHDEVAALSTRGVNRLVPATGHLIPSENPQAVIEAVREVAAMRNR